MDIAVGVVMVILGFVVAFAGLRVFSVALPVLGFLAGMALGVELIHHFFDDGFLTTSVGIIAGIVIGIIFAILSYMFWYVAVVLGGAFIGATVGVGLMNLFNVNTDWVLAAAAIIGAIVMGLMTVLFDLPVYWALVMTAFAGASWLVAGVMLIFNRIDRENLEYGTAWAAIEESWFWIVIWIVVAALAIGSQMSKLTEAMLPESKWEQLPSPQV